MRIGELAKRSSLSVDTLRFYEKKGLIDADLVQRQENNYRDYSDACLVRLSLIQKAKHLGFSLVEIQEWIREFESDQMPLREKQRILRQKLEEIETRIQDLVQMKEYLAHKINAIEA